MPQYLGGLRMPPRRRAKPPEWRREGVRRTIFPLRKDKTRPKIAKIREIEMKIPTAKAAPRRAGSLALPTEAGSRPGTLVPRPSGKGPGRGSPFLVSGASAGKNPNHFSRRHARREKSISRSEVSHSGFAGARRPSGVLRHRRNARRSGGAFLVRREALLPSGRKRSVSAG